MAFIRMRVMLHLRLSTMGIFGAAFVAGSFRSADTNVNVKTDGEARGLAQPTETKVTDVVEELGQSDDPTHGRARKGNAQTAAAFVWQHAPQEPSIPAKHWVKPAGKAVNLYSTVDLPPDTLAWAPVQQPARFQIDKMKEIDEANERLDEALDISDDEPGRDLGSLVLASTDQADSDSAFSPWAWPPAGLKSSPASAANGRFSLSAPVKQTPEKNVAAGKWAERAIPRPASAAASELTPEMKKAAASWPQASTLDGRFSLAPVKQTPEKNVAAGKTVIPRPESAGASELTPEMIKMAAVWAQATYGTGMADGGGVLVDGVEADRAIFATIVDQDFKGNLKIQFKDGATGEAKELSGISPSQIRNVKR